MNREQRRKNARAELKYLNTPCTITEAAQISRGVAEDVVADYDHQHKHLQVAITLQLEILKNLVISKGLITEEEFREQYMMKATEFNQRQMEAFKEANSEEEDNLDGDDEGNSSSDAKIEPKVSDIEVKKA